MAVTRTMVVWCPDWPIVAGGHALDEPVAVFHANRVVACSPAARVDGVNHGLRRRSAQARCPGLVVVERDRDGEARRFEAVAAALDAITPRIEITRPGTCAFPTRGPSRYFGGDAPMADRVLALVTGVLADTGTVRIGVADGPFAAGLAARKAPDGGAELIASGDSPDFLAPFVVGVLERPELTDVLVRLGLHTLGDFAALDATDVIARFGADGVEAHRSAAGLDERPPATTEPPADLEVTVELDPPIDRVDQAAFVAKTAADDLDRMLGERGAVCTRVLIGAETEHGERRERLWRHEGALTAAAVAQRMRWQLDGWLNGAPATRPSGGLSLVYLRPDEIGPATGRQLGFWGEQTAGVERAAKAVARVQGLLGPRSVAMVEYAGGRQPHDQMALVPVDGAALADQARSLGRSVSTPWPGQLPPPSPIVIHRRPLPARVLDRQRQPVQVSGRGLVSGAPCWLGVGAEPTGWLEVTGWAGPWPLDERWWDPDHARRRARFQVVTNDGRARLLGLEGQRWWIDAAYE